MVMPGELDRAFRNTSSTGANTSITASLSALAGQRNYITNYQIIAGGATAAGQVTATIAGLISGTRSVEVNVQAGVNNPPQIVEETFDPPLPASALNTAISLNLPALGAGNVVASVAITGFSLVEP